jgi:sterol desaturase/sphingolipid hydroxylase (fatty acid hydroxylase superfamily)
MHHDAELSARGVNFGGMLMIWDRLFGSYATPRRVREFGIAGTRVPGNWRELYTTPFEAPRD